jgi:hypothetical protein
MFFKLVLMDDPWRWLCCVVLCCDRLPDYTGSEPRRLAYNSLCINLPEDIAQWLSCEDGNEYSYFKKAGISLNAEHLSSFKELVYYCIW